MPRPRGAWTVLAALVLSLLLILGAAATAAANSGAKVVLTFGSAEPVESVTTQLGAEVTNGGGDWFVLHVKPTGGEGCNANPDADNGETVIRNPVTSESNPATLTQNWTFQLAGSYRVCAWVEGENKIVASAESTFHVRPPHLSISISVPPAVSVGQTFQVVTTAQAETERQLLEYIVPNTNNTCPANAAASASAPGNRTVLNDWSVNGGPFTETRNESLDAAGRYLVCAYFEYPSNESVPELASSAVTSVVPPCVVPAFSLGAALVSVEAQLRSASCSVGKLHYAASSNVRVGGVLGLSPRPGTNLAAGAAVTVDVSAGRPCIVPSVRPGANVRRVERQLASADCTFVVARSRSHRVHRGSVVGLGSRAGSHLFPRTSVRIIVAS